MSHTQRQLKLRAHIHNLNEKIERKALESGSIMFVKLSINLDHWAALGISTVARFEHYMASTKHCELYKQVYGYEPDNINYNELTIRQIQEDIKQLMDYQSAEKDLIKDIKDSCPIENATKDLSVLKKAETNFLEQINHLSFDDISGGLTAKPQKAE